MKRKQRPTLVQIMTIFAPADRIIEELEQDGTVSVNERGAPVFEDEGEWHEIAPALNGWIGLWERLIVKCRLSLDLEPLRKLSNKLAYGVELAPSDVAQAKAVIQECRRLYRGMDWRKVASVAMTERIDINLRRTA